MNENFTQLPKILHDPGSRGSSLFATLLLWCIGVFEKQRELWRNTDKIERIRCYKLALAVINSNKTKITTFPSRTYFYIAAIIILQARLAKANSQLIYSFIPSPS